DPVQVRLVDGGRATVVHAHVERVPAAVALDPVLDRVAGDRATGGARGDGDVAATFAVGIAARQLLGGDCTDDAAQHRAGDIGAAVGGTGFDRHHRAAVVAARTGRDGRGAVPRPVVGRGAGAAGQRQGGRGGDAGGAHAVVHRGLLAFVFGGRHVRHGSDTRRVAVNAAATVAAARGGAEAAVQSRFSRAQAASAVVLVACLAGFAHLGCRLADAFAAERGRGERGIEGATELRGVADEARVVAQFREGAFEVVAEAAQRLQVGQGVGGAAAVGLGARAQL